MPYCRKCGTKLDEQAHFCHKCGTPVATYTPATPTAPVKPMRKDPLVLLVIMLSAILITAAVAAVIIAVPTQPVNFSQTNQDSNPNIHTLNLNFQADAAEVNIITQNLNDRNILIAVTASGSRGIFGSENPIQVTFTNETANDALTITSKIIQENVFSSRLRVVCTIYVNPALNLNLNVSSGTAQVSLTADKPTTFQSLSLQATTGTVQANLQNVTVAGNISLETQTGTVNYRMYQTDIMGNRTVNLQSNTGDINMDITQPKAFQGNLVVNASTSTGSINIGLEFDGDVGAKITSHTDLGNIRLQDIRSFSGNKSPIQSNNYPASANIEINNKANVGDINIKASYQSTVTPTIKN